MDVNVNVTFNFPVFLTGLLSWGVIGFLAYRFYKRQTVKPTIWKATLFLIVGLFSFTFSWNMFDTLIKLPILPLGVWILYFIFKNKGEQWQNYRSFAWLGFYANFIFLASTLIAIPIHHAVYPQDKPSTYISTIENASIITIHPSAKEVPLNKESLQKQISSMSQSRIYSEKWYEETYMKPDPNNMKERFPYQLIGTIPKWGSGLKVIIYIENDGKGLLLTTSKQQLYFRSEASLLGEGHINEK